MDKAKALDMPTPRVGRYMLTYTGRKFYPADIRPGDICIEDIAHGLAGEMRFGGQSPRRITVAEHSILVAQVLSGSSRLMGLLHDASEAFLKDIPSPVKVLLPDYKELESAVMRAVAYEFGLPAGFQHGADIKVADAYILTREQEVGWAEAPLYSSDLVQCLDPKVAEYQFLNLYQELRSAGYTNPKEG